MLFKLILSLFAAYLIVDASFACNIRVLPAEERIKSADAIFIGSVLSEHKSSRPSDLDDHFAKIQVKEVFKGKLDKTVKVYYLRASGKNPSICKGNEASLGGYAGSKMEVIFYVKREGAKLVTRGDWSAWPVKSHPGQKDLLELKKISTAK